MPSKYFPFDSTFTGVDSNGIPQGDRGATSADWAAYVSRMFTDGYFRLLDGQLEPSISATPMAVDIAAGSAMIKGRQYSQDETVTVSLGQSDSQPRIDRIVLRMSTEVVDRKISLVVLKGTPAASPVAPVLTRTASVYDICLAQIAVGANAIQIIEDNLSDTRNDEALCGYVKILLDGRYYPDGTLPELLWVYTMYPDTLSAGQKAVIEGDTELMGIYNESYLRKVENKTTPKIGDILISSRADLSEEWALCNNQIFDPSAYPDLASILGLGLSRTWGEKQLYPSLTSHFINNIFYNGTHWILQHSGGTSICKAGGSLLDGTWTQLGARDFIVYGGGYWVAASGSSNEIMYTTDPLGTWSQKAIINGNASSMFVYANGYWGMPVNYSGSNNLYYCNGAPSGSWTPSMPVSAPFTWFFNYLNGYWLGITNTGALYYTSNSSPASGWTASPLSSGTNWIAYGNGLWVAGTTAGVKYCSAATPAGTWTTHPSGVTTAFTKVYYFNNKWYGLSGSSLYEADTPSGTWTLLMTFSSTIRTLFFNNNTYYVGASGQKLALLYATHRIPLVTADSSYAYMKTHDA